MVGVKQLILSVYLFFQEIDVFCIRNELTDGSSFRASLLYSFARVGKAFTQHMERGTKTCCHYTKKDCSRNQRSDDPTTFRIYLYFMDGSSDTRIAKCTTGGALIIRGAKSYYHGECIGATGISNTFMLPKEDA